MTLERIAEARIMIDSGAPADARRPPDMMDTVGNKVAAKARSR